MKTYWFTDLSGEFLALEESSTQLGDDPSPVAFGGGNHPEWQREGETDLLLMPEARAFDEAGHYFVCNVETTNGQFGRCPRTVSKRLSVLLQEMKLTVLIGVELEFHLFDSVSLQTSFYSSEFKISGRDGSMFEGSPLRMVRASQRHKRIPKDAYSLCRSACIDALVASNISVCSDSHESGFCQNEIALKPMEVTRVSDAIQIAKQIIRDVAAQHGFIATFAPKPLANDYGNSLHVNMSLWREGVNIFFEAPHVLSDVAMRFGSGVLKHIRALNALLNTTTNSYGRLLSTFNYRLAPAIEVRNRWGVARVPHFFNSSAARIEFRFPDAHANPYTGIAALVLAGLDGMERREEPTVLPSAGQYPASRMCHSLFEAAEALERNHSFLLRDQIFDEDLIRGIRDLAFGRHLTTSRHPNPAEMHALF